jgi:hypothetical protein
MEYVAAAMAIIGVVTSLTGAAEAKEDAAAAAAKEAGLEGIVTEAKIKSLETEERILRGKTLASAAGSNIKVDRGSPLQILTEQARTFADEKRTIARAGASRAALAQTRGRMVGNQAMYAGLGAAAASASTAFSLFAAARKG